MFEVTQVMAVWGTDYIIDEGYKETQGKARKIPDEIRNFRLLKHLKEAISEGYDVSTVGYAIQKIQQRLDVYPFWISYFSTHWRWPYRDPAGNKLENLSNNEPYSIPTFANFQKIRLKADRRLRWEGNSNPLRREMPQINDLPTE
jgi:hypothetical protein